MSKRGRASHDAEEEVAHAVELLCARPAHNSDYKDVTLTPLERQVVALKESLPRHVMLLVACGYRVKFYGRDSRVVSRRSGIMCIPGHPFEYSSVPYTKVDLYIRRLVAMGYHVAFADQESAAVRAVDGVKSGIFQRTISGRYSRGTLLPSEQVATGGAAGPTAIGEGEDCEEGGAWADPVDTYSNNASELFLCFLDPPSWDGGPVTAAFVSFVSQRRETHTVQTSLGLEDLLHQYDVVEVIVVATSARIDAADCQLLPEKYAAVLETALRLNHGPTTNGVEDSSNVSICSFPKGTASLDDAIEAYLRPFKLDAVYAGMTRLRLEDAGSPTTTVNPDIVKTEQLTHFVLPGSTLRALDVFTSSAGAEGSLLALVSSCVTPCGARRLRSWVASPLAEKAAILGRQEVVGFLIRGGDCGALENILREVFKAGDIEATIGKMQAQRCSVLEYLRLLRAVRTIYHLVHEVLEQTQLPDLLQSLLRTVCSEAVTAYIQARAAEMESSATTPIELFTSKEMTPSNVLHDHITDRERATAALTAELDHIRQVLRMPGLEYRTVAGTPFVIDIPIGKADRVLSDWTVLTRTKTNIRFHTPRIMEANIALCAARERLAAAAQRAWCEMQAELSCPAHLTALLSVIEAVASLDALRSLSVASSRRGYVAPQLVVPQAGHEGVRITEGRHPMLDQKLESGYVSCDVQLQSGGTWLLTGPNMGGKSALMRMIGCFTILAQIGSYVPAAEATLPVFTGLYCRMGSSDSILEGHSTFYMEMEETSRILGSPNLCQSLVLMDELGRGTSSFDGVAVADAILHYLMNRHVTCVFVTHYNYLCEPFASPASGSSGVACYYMGFREAATSAKGGEESQLVFTYRPCRGITPSSFGVDVAKLAGLPSPVIDEARRLSLQEERLQMQRLALSGVAQFLQ